jgi:hypothetical protein
MLLLHVRVWTSLKLVSCIHVRLISLTYVPSDSTLNIWRSDVDRCAIGRGKHRDSSLWTHRIVDLWREVPDGYVVPVWNVIIHNGARRRSWAPGSTIRRVVHNDNLEQPAHEQKARHTTTIGFEFPRSLKNSATTFQAAVRQPAMTDLIDGSTRPPIGTPSTTTRSSGLALSEMRTMKPKESAWSSVAIRNRSIPLARDQRTMDPQWQNAAYLNQVALHLSLDFSTVWP